VTTYATLADLTADAVDGLPDLPIPAPPAPSCLVFVPASEIVRALTDQEAAQGWAIAAALAGEDAYTVGGHFAYLTNPEAFAMALNIQRLAAYQRTLDAVVTLDDGMEEVVRLVYVPAALTTPAMAGQIRQAQGDNFRSVELLAEMLATVLVGWDVTSDGQPYPPTREALAVLPGAFLGAVMQAINADLPAAMASMKLNQEPAAAAPVVPPSPAAIAPIAAPAIQQQAVSVG